MTNFKSTLNNKKFGVYTWLLIRISAVLILIYSFFVLKFTFFSKKISYEEWYSFFSLPTTKIFSLIALLAILYHTGTGIHHILVDYMRFFKLKKIEIFLIKLTRVILFIYFFYGTIIIWSI